MAKKNQSNRLSAQQKSTEGVIGIFGTEAKWHDLTVNRLSNRALTVLEKLYPKLEFRYRNSIKKEEINNALRAIDSDLGQTLFVANSSIIPDGGIIEVKDDNGNWRIILVSEAKHQGKDIENIRAGKLVGKNNNQDLMAALSNAIERSHKNISEIANLMLGESHFPYILFLEGSNFLTETISIQRPDGRVVNLEYNSGMLNRLDRLTAANYGMPINTNLCRNKFVMHGDKTIMLQATSIFTQGNGEKWDRRSMLEIMIDIAKTSLQVLGSDLFSTIVKQLKLNTIMARNATNTTLHKAKAAKSDEFYTQYCDIERELQYYVPQFHGKTVYCNCDRFGQSNFIQFFIDNFDRYGLKKLIASYYIKDDNSLFSETPHETGGYIEYNGSSENIEIKKFSGSGDFRLTESINLLKQADIIVTNPPFSLFREFISQLINHDKQFLVIGNINALTYKEIFGLIKDNRIWLGYNFGRGISGFIVPEYYDLYGTETKIDNHGNKIISTNNCLWLTNLQSPLRNKFLPLTRKYKGSEDKYPKFDNYDGININKTIDIPWDYTGAMGVPITFLHKYNPLQFEIIQFRKGNDGKDLSVNGSCPYFRVLIRNITDRCS